MSNLNELKRWFVERRNAITLRDKPKYFCIGRNKTGTTSLKRAFKDLGYIVGNQQIAERLYDHYYFDGRYDTIIKYCRTAEVFQDVPFSCPDLFPSLDQAYPGSKFILTIRDDVDQWYRSISKFHAKKFGRDGALPTVDDLRKADYVRPGFALNTMRLHGTTEDDPYNAEIMKAHYEAHNRAVMDYFFGRENDLLVINVGDAGAYQDFIKFLGIESERYDFSWENKT